MTGKITVHCINPQNMAYWGVPKNTLKTMDFEREYMPGNVAAEMGDCKEIEALKAQAIAGRSYALRYISLGAAIYDTGKAQAYLASRANSARYALHRKAAEDTAGIVVAYEGTPVITHYSASNGGRVRDYNLPWEIEFPDKWDNTKVKHGHGAGMSQNGAENMARAGKTYREILAYYYPGTALMGEYGEAVSDTIQVDNHIEAGGEIVENVNKIIAYARAQVGKPYKLGTSGPAQFDCSGLTKRAVQQIGLDWYHGATTQWNRGFTDGDAKRYDYWVDSGTIDTLPMNKVAFLFNRDKVKSGVMAHVGIYDGQGKVIQAGGYGGKGVHNDPIDKRRWTHWATLTEANVVIEQTSLPTLKRGASGEYVTLLQNLLNQHGADLKVTGKLDALTQAAVKAYQAIHHLKVDGICGPITWESLTRPAPTEQ
jgi:cell wall-associated NlpC family hydrolase